MLGTSHSARKKALGATERRRRARTPVTPPIYADLGKVNGGLIYNMSEDGLALSAAMILGGDELLRMRILLPDSGGWMKATGQITWKSESGKTAGIRFVGLPAATCQRITDWLASESSPGDPQSGAEIDAKPQQRPAGVLAGTSVFSSPDPRESSTVAEQRIPELYLPEDSSVLINQPAGIVAEFLPQSTRVGSHNLAGQDSSAQPRERRVHPRQPNRPLSYIDLGRDIGGWLLNISEGGLAVAVAVTLTEKDLPSIRIKFRGSRDQIEVSGQIAWISESKREAGIRFVNATESERQIIARRISRQQLPSKLQEQNVRAPDRLAIHPEIPEIPKLKILAPVAPPSGRVVQQHWQGSAPPPLVVTGGNAEKETLTFVASDVWPPKTSERNESKHKSTPVFTPLSTERGSERRRRLAVTVILSGVAAVAIGWVATPPAARKELIAFIGQSTEGLNQRAELNNPIPAAKTTDAPALLSENSGPQSHGFEQVPADRPPNGSAGQLEAEPPQVGKIDRRAATPTANSAVRRAENSLPESQPAKPPERIVVAMLNPAVENTRSQLVERSPARPTESTAAPATSPAAQNARSQVVESSPAQPTESTAMPATNPAARVPSGTATEVKESPPPPLKPPTASVAPTWSVAVSTDPYPSIRVPADISSQKPSSERSLQIGRAISLVEPVYPEDAKSQGIEGTVKLHVVVGGDGSVQNVELTSGSVLLAKAATSAIREWHYAKTLLGGQPVETEQDVIVKFRMAGPVKP